MQVAIRNCAKLYFFKDNPDAQIILRTDASDYGTVTVRIYVRLLVTASILYSS